ncbi:DgyrCDS9363 [Dimorphilus gyrociliatus]|uniref:DgyrCDS9363 n=1 Tax=Dimorphilus gyrociliatus TaxID=2664684 RepID=A0A7I8VYY9_9ANNE|nr:DgyrCDS9363 [Dimorphilus gyrociliatus]
MAANVLMFKWTIEKQKSDQLKLPSRSLRVQPINRLRKNCLKKLYPDIYEKRMMDEMNDVDVFDYVPRMVQPGKNDIFKPSPSRTRVKIATFDDGDEDFASRTDGDNDYILSPEEKEEVKRERLHKRPSIEHENYVDDANDVHYKIDQEPPIRIEKTVKIATKPEEDNSRKSSITCSSVGRNMRAEAWQMELINKRLDEQTKNNALQRIIDYGKANNL